MYLHGQHSIVQSAGQTGEHVFNHALSISFVFLLINPFLDNIRFQRDKLIFPQDRLDVAFNLALIINLCVWCKVTHDVIFIPVVKIVCHADFRRLKDSAGIVIFCLRLCAFRNSFSLGTVPAF